MAAPPPADGLLPGPAGTAAAWRCAARRFEEHSRGVMALLAALDASLVPGLEALGDHPRTKPAASRLFNQASKRRDRRQRSG